MRQFGLQTPAEPIRILLDAAQMQLVLRNLLQNAVKYSPADTPITITLTTDNEAVLVAVQDQGYGISSTDQAQIFERFYRGDLELTHTIRGVGLGLAICREIVRAHGGRIWLKSEAGKGSTFFVQLPLQPASLKGVKI
jgi:two-component system sensor histidine kinase VicK